MVLDKSGTFYIIYKNQLWKCCLTLAVVKPYQCCIFGPSFWTRLSYQLAFHVKDQDSKKFNAEGHDIRDAYSSQPSAEFRSC